MGDDSWAFVGLGRSGFQSKKPVGLEDQWESWSKNGLILAAEHKEASAQGAHRSGVMVPSCLGVGGAGEGTGLPGGAPAHRALPQPGFCSIEPSGVAPGPWQSVDVCSWVRAAGCWSCARNPELLAQRIWGRAVPQALRVC